MEVRIIIQNCNQCELDMPLKYAQQLYNKYQIRHPSAFFLRTRSRFKNWDGKVKLINKNGVFKIGLLPSVVQSCKEMGLKVKIIDLRQKYFIPKKAITKLGDYKLRPEQVSALNAIIHNKINGQPFHIGVMDCTVNFGKSILMAALYMSFERRMKTLLITQDADWLKQAQSEFKDYLPGENITYVQGGNITNWSNFTIGMVQSISRNIRKYQNELVKFDMVLVDEADLANNKTYQNVLTHLYNTKIRLGLSGTIYMSTLSKDKLNNMTLESFFGKRIYEFRLSQSIKKGYSTKVIVKMVGSEPWFGNKKSKYIDYKDIYDDMITKNELAYKIVLDRLLFNLKYGRIPAIVVCKFIKHAENLYVYLAENLVKHGYNLKIGCVHVDTPTKVRDATIKAFRSGDIDLLISTTIIARGKNFPLLRYMINAASMDSQEKSIQFLGRLVRSHNSKSKAYLDDIHYQGDYLNRHGNHRKRYYLKEKLKVITLSKLWKEYPSHRPNQIVKPFL